MIDLHSHALPGLDDGARTLHESLTMAREWVAAGVTRVACTPHSGPPLTRPVVAQAVARLQAALDTQGIPLALTQGVEVFLEPDMAALIEQELAYPFVGSRYILVELPFDIWPPNTESVLFMLQLKGLAPILAHPERYAAVRARSDRIKPLVERGILMQITAGALTGAMGRDPQSCAELLLRRGLVHLIASDSHRPGQPASLLKARQVAARLVGETTARRLVEDNPAAILADEDLI